MWDQRPYTLSSGAFNVLSSDAQGMLVAGTDNECPGEASDIGWPALCVVCNRAAQALDKCCGACSMPTISAAVQGA